MECKEFTELKNSNAVDIRTGCIAIITRDKNSNCISGVGETLRFCPYCGAEIKSEYKDGSWSWWHSEKEKLTNGK